MSACWPLQMPPTPKAVLVSLADNANDHGDCWPSIPKICERTCFSERAVQAAIHWLEDHGALTANRENGRHTKYHVSPDAYKPPQEMHPRTTRTPAADAEKTAKPPQEMHPPPQEVPSNRHKPSKAKATVKSEERVRAARFTPPTETEVADYCRERGKGVDPERWFAHYTSNGWRVGRNPMRDWRAAVRTWERNELNRDNPHENHARHREPRKSLADQTLEWAAGQHATGVPLDPNDRALRPSLDIAVR